MKTERLLEGLMREPPADAVEGVPPGWYLACRSKDLRRAPLGLELCGHALVLFRDGEGRPAALEDRCAHRNVPLSAGTVCEGRLRCAYHGWEYNRDGEVVRIPAVPDACAGGGGVAAFPAAEQDGFVWLWMGAAPPSGAPVAFARLGEPGWTSFTMHTRFTGTVEACLENFLDCPHATFVHRYWFRAPTNKPVKAVVRTLADGAEAEFFEEPREKSAVWWMLAPRQGEMKHTDRFIAPNTSRVDYAFPDGLHYVITSSCTPVSARETQVTTVISFRYGRLGALVRLFFEPLSRRIIRQDVEMLKLQADNIERFGRPQFRSTPADLLGPDIAAWRRALARGEAPPAPGAPRHVDLHL